MSAARRPAISDLTEVEIMSAIARKVREGALPPIEAGRLAAEFLGHLRANLYRRVAMERRHYETARDWIARLAVPLRALDALQLAVAAAEDLEFATADSRLVRAAHALGVRVVS